MAASFEAPGDKLVFERSSFLHPNSSHDRIIDEHYFNSCMEMIVPTPCDVIPACQDLRETFYYQIQQLPVYQLMNKEFIEAFVKKGKLYMLTCDTPVDTSNSAAILPTGVLVMHLNKDTYEKLGIVGQSSIYRRKKKKQFVVSINLTETCFTPGKKNYERVCRSLKKEENMSFDFHMCWQPKDEKICPSSVGVYFERFGFKCKVHTLRGKVHDLNPTPVPVIKSTAISDGGACNYEDFYEWLGGMACEINFGGQDDKSQYLSTFMTPEPNESDIICSKHRWTGLIPTHCVKAQLQLLRKCVQEKKLPWGSLTVHGYMDSPVSWKHREHGFHISGDNLYTYVVFPNQDYWLYIATGSHDVCM